MRTLFITILVTALQGGIAFAQPEIEIQWTKVLRVSRSNASLQVVVTPPMSRGSPLHGKIWQALQDLNAEYVRFVPWLPYPRLAVAELEPPENGRTSWDFSLLDPLAIDFLEATKGHTVMLNFSTIPQWMFKTPKPVRYPADPNRAVWDYTQGTELRDPSMKELGNYYARLVKWYTQGGFVDEFGKQHDSAHHYHWDYWEVLNEPDLEHKMSPEQYTLRYDAIVEAIREVQPKMKFVGLALAGPTELPRYFEYFLDPRHHKPGIPRDMISYHFYASISAATAKAGTWEDAVFDQTRNFLRTVKRIEAVRQRLSPQTATAINELGVIHHQDGSQGQPGYVFKPFPASYWNLCAAQFAFLYGELANLGIEMIGQSALMQVPDFFPSVTMMDWETGRPNARYWALKLLRENFGPGDKLVATSSAVPGVYAQAFLAKDGKRKVLLVNTRNKPAELSIAGAAGGMQEIVDQTTGCNPPVSRRLDSDKFDVKGLAVQVITLPTAAHVRSESSIVDPVYDATRLAPSPDFYAGPPWRYGDGELETWQLKIMRQRSKAVCLHVGYPGAFHEPSAHAFFRLPLPARLELPQAFQLTAFGDVTVTVNGTTVLHAANRAQPHTVKLDTLPKASANQLQIEVAAAGGEPPAIFIPDGPCSTTSGDWTWSTDGRHWGATRAFAPSHSGLPPHKVEQAVVALRPVATKEAGLIDFGRTIMARVSFRCEGTPALVVGESAAEARDPRPEVHEQRADLEQTANGCWRSRYPLAFRYLKITGGAATDVKAEALFHPVQYRGAFACSDPRLTRIWMQSAYTLRLCMNELMVDGIKRDRLPWIGDQAMNVAVDAYTFADAEIFRRTFTALGRNGVEATDINGIIDYSLWWVINHDAFQRFFDDPAYLRLEWPRIKALLKFMESHCDHDGFLVPRRGTWLFIDWGAAKNPKLTNVPLQVLWFWALRSGAALAERSHDQEAAAAWRKRAAALEKTLQLRAWDATARGWRLNVDAPGELSRHANLLAVVSNLATPAQYADVRKHLLGSELPPAVTPFMTSLEILALSRAGASEEIASRIEKYWGPMLDRGATTFWESYNPAARGNEYVMYNRPYGNSLCHAWASGPAALLPGELLGLRPLADGWKTFAVEPKLGSLAWAAATVPTPHGDIEVLADKGSMTLHVPAGTTAKWRSREIPGPAQITEKL